MPPSKATPSATVDFTLSLAARDRRRPFCLPLRRTSHCARPSRSARRAPRCDSALASSPPPAPPPSISASGLYRVPACPRARPHPLRQLQHSLTQRRPTSRPRPHPRPHLHPHPHPHARTPTRAKPAHPAHAPTHVPTPRPQLRSPAPAPAPVRHPHALTHRPRPLARPRFAQAERARAPTHAQVPTYLPSHPRPLAPLRMTAMRGLGLRLGRCGPALDPRHAWCLRHRVTLCIRLCMLHAPCGSLTCARIGRRARGRAGRQYGMRGTGYTAQRWTASRHTEWHWNGVECRAPRRVARADSGRAEAGPARPRAQSRTAPCPRPASRIVRSGFHD